MGSGENRFTVIETMERLTDMHQIDVGSEVDSSTPVSRVRVAAVDDHESVRLGLRAACLDAGYEFVEEGADVDSLVAALAGREVDVVVLDLSLGDGSIVTENVKKIQATGAGVLIGGVPALGGAQTWTLTMRTSCGGCLPNE